MESRIEWQKAYGSERGDLVFAVEPANDGGYILAGGTNSFGDRDFDIWLWKADDKGSIPACREDWIKNTDIRARETQSVAREGHQVSRDTHLIPKESHAWIKEMQGRDVDICAGIPQIFVDPPSRIFSFPGVKVGQSSSKAVELSSRGTGDLKIKSVKVSGPPFSQKNDCTIVFPGQSCSISVTFKPAARGPRNDRLEIFSNDPEEGLLSIKLLGRGNKRLDLIAGRRAAESTHPLTHGPQP